jgi:hypothetical protein
MAAAGVASYQRPTRCGVYRWRISRCLLGSYGYIATNVSLCYVLVAGAEVSVDRFFLARDKKNKHLHAEGAGNESLCRHSSASNTVPPRCNVIAQGHIYRSLL